MHVIFVGVVGGVSVDKRNVDPRSRCCSKERRILSFIGLAGGSGSPVVVLEFAVVDSQDSVVGASCGAGSLSLFLQGIAG